MLETIGNQFFGLFDWGLVISINIMSYVIIKFWEEANGKKSVTSWQKDLVTILSCIILGVGYGFMGTSWQVAVQSSIAASVLYAKVLKPILKKLKIQYLGKDNEESTD
jgi:predicted negative regulator of RcsB-dependent stress response